ncbi:MAG TPA: CPBP family intramembrane glutamic endopeptidase [Candidatus Acidoferrales bacterium]
MNADNQNLNLFEPEPGSQPHGSSPTAPEIIANTETQNAIGVPLPPPAPPRFSLSLPEDLRVPWDWWDLGLVALIGFAVLVVFGMALGAHLQKSGITKEQFENSAIFQAQFTIYAMCGLSAVLLLYLFAQMRLRFRSPFWRTMRWHRLEIAQLKPATAALGFVVGGVLLSILVALVSSRFTPKHQMPIEQYFQDRHTALLLLIMSVTVAPFFEETIFRGYLYPVVARTFGIVPGVVLTGLLFGLLHASQLGGNLPQVGLLVMVGIVFTIARAKTGNVLPGYLLHVSYNSFIAIAFLIASHGLRHMPPT